MRCINLRLTYLLTYLLADAYNDDRTFVADKLCCPRLFKLVLLHYITLRAFEQINGDGDDDDDDDDDD